MSNSKPATGTQPKVPNTTHVPAVTHVKSKQGIHG